MVVVGGGKRRRLHWRRLAETLHPLYSHMMRRTQPTRRASSSFPPLAATMTPASSQLPDEIIKEILLPALFVPDKLFSNTSMESNPFAGYELSSSTILVVCKSWLRVATPLLYETVVLRSKAQAQALAGVLKNNSPLGHFIKKLRLEGGYGTFA